MANISQTYSGDFTSFISGKLLNAAGMAKGESNRREENNLQKAKPGSLFARALQSEFGGDLYNRTLGNFDPRKSAEETNRSSSKEGRYTAQFKDTPSKTKSDLEEAEKELLKDDDSIPVKNVDAREHISKIIGVGLDVKLIQADARIQKVSNQVSSVQDTVVQTQKLLVDQTELLGAKFDTILDIFSGQLAYQQKISDEAEVRRRETELEQEKDLSTTKKIESIGASKKQNNLFTGILGDLIKKILRKKTKGLSNLLLGALKGKSAPIRSIIGSFVKAVFQGKNPLGKTALIRKVDKKFKRGLVLGLKQFSDYGKGNADQIADRLIKDPKGSAALADFAKASAGQGFRTDAKMGTAASQQRNMLEEMLGKPPEDNLKAPRKITKKGKKSAVKTTAKKFQQNISTKAGVKATNKAAEKLTGKVAEKSARKSLKFIPGIGTGISIIEAGYRASQGDTTGALLSLGSAIPFVGWGFVAADIARDLGYDPMNTLPANQQYEKGTNLTKPGLGNLHGTEAILGKKDRSDMLSSYQQAIDQVGSTLVSSSVSFADAVGMGGEVKSHLKSTGLTFDIVNIPVSTNIGRGSKSGPLSSLENSFNRDIFARVGDKEEVLEDRIEDAEDTDNQEQPDPQNNGGQRRRPSTTLPNGSYASGTWIGSPGDDDGQQTGLNMNLPGGIGTPIYAPVDLIYRSIGTDGKPAVGLDGTPDALGPSGSGFGYYGAYYFEKDGREYEVLMGHFRDLPYKGSSEGEKIPKGTLLGYQGASGRSVSNTDGVYPHISLHVNGIGHLAGNDVLRWFANGLASGKASSGPGAPGYGNGGDRDKAFHELAKDEALSSLTPGVNDFVKPGGRSVISNTPWDSITDDTMLYVYADSEGVPTIGYGSAAMRGITFKSSPITVRQAKAWLRDDINRISTGLSENIKWWDSLTDSQRAGLIMFEYNAGEGNSYISSKGYPSLVRALEEGNIRAAIEEIQRTGPAQSRIDVEQELLRSGPQQIVGPKKVGPKIVGEGKVGSGIPFFPDLTIMKGVQDGLKSNRERERNSELLKLFPVLNNKSKDLQSNSSLVEDMEESFVMQQVYIVNNTIATTSLPPVITSSGRSKDNYVEQYRMAVLGA